MLLKSKFLQSKGGLLNVLILSILLVTVLVVIFYDSKMNTSLQIAPEKKQQLDYENWETYDEKKALLPTTAKSRSVMLLHGYLPFWNAGSEVPYS
jgi:hypothetical protein